MPIFSQFHQSLQNQPGTLLPAKIGSALKAAAAHFPGKLGIGQHVHDLIGEVAWIMGVGEQSRTAGNVRTAVGVRGYHWASARHCLHQRVGAAFVMQRDHEKFREVLKHRPFIEGHPLAQAHAPEVRLSEAFECHLFGCALADQHQLLLHLIVAKYAGPHRRLRVLALI
jgi:hypothetical protein